jgi:transcription initiation factor TFIIIB Brf1 subunit/transcription initiation factor TFIIB
MRPSPGGRGPSSGMRRGELVRSNCAFVLLEKEENAGPGFTSEQGRPELASGPPTSIARPDMGRSTLIGRSDTDALLYRLFLFPSAVAKFSFTLNFTILVIKP